MHIGKNWKEKYESDRTWTLETYNSDDGWCTFSLLGSVPNQRHRRVMHESMVQAWLEKV